MRVRPADLGELSKVFSLTYDFANGISRTRHIVECKRNPKLRSGKHFILERDDGTFLATVTAYRFVFPNAPITMGLANLFVPPEHRAQGFGHAIIHGTLDHYDNHSIDAIYLLSSIGLPFYERFGFRELPLRYEAAPECHPMLRCPDPLWDKLSQYRPYLRGLMAFVD